MSLNYSDVGLKVGLEVHQQLDTAQKLFCSCKPTLFKEKPKIEFTRQLRPTQSELGQIDPAAYFEFQKGVKILYEANNESSCLVEMDEEPPHALNREAVQTALTVALMLNAKPADEIHVMRKTVIDGSNTTGFQRTCIIAVNGQIEIDSKKIPIQLVALEEDAARRMGDENGGHLIRYRIDRLGIPLIEVTTAPVLYSPQEAEKTSLVLGRILRGTRKVKRGLGTIRQDLNVSISKGALVEIKGVQELRLVSTAVAYEVQRQLKLLNIQKELKNRGIDQNKIKDEFIDSTRIFQATNCRVISKALKENKKILAIKLEGFKDLLKTELTPESRFGSEMADIARFWGRVDGIFHTDELPAYGITAKEVEDLNRLMGATEQDAVVFVADTQENAKDALKAVADRAREALKGVPEETRGANPDGSTRFLRPRPGAARMYPETDVSLTRLTENYLANIRTSLPETPTQKMDRLIRSYRLNEKLTRQVLDSECEELLETIVSETQVSPTTVAVVLTEIMKSLKREGIQIENVSNEQVRELFRLMSIGMTVKEAIPQIISWLAKHEGSTTQEAIKSLGLTMISETEIEKLIDDLIQKNKDMAKNKSRDAAFGEMMGMIMKTIRGKATAEQVSRILNRKLKQ